MDSVLRFLADQWQAVIDHSGLLVSALLTGAGAAYLWPFAMKMFGHPPED